MKKELNAEVYIASMSRGAYYEREDRNLKAFVDIVDAKDYQSKLYALSLKAYLFYDNIEIPHYNDWDDSTDEKVIYYSNVYEKRRYWNNDWQFNVETLELQ